MDINELSVLGSDNGEPMTLKHPVQGGDLLNDEGKPMRIWFKSRDSKEFRQAKSRAKSFAKEKAVDPEDMQVIEDAYLLTRLATKFENLQFEGKPLKFTEKTALNLFMADEYPWIREQASIFILDRKNFLSKAQSA